MPTTKATDPKQTQNRILILALVSGMMMTASMGVVMLVLAGSSDDVDPGEPSWMGDRIAPAKLEVAEQGEAAPGPSTMNGTEGGYGRPEPLFGSAGSPGGSTDGGVAPLFIDPAAPPVLPQAAAGPGEVQAVGTRPDAGSLPGRYGNAYAPVRLVVFNDFECPFCSRLEATLEAVHERYPTQVEIYFRDYPLTMHAHARGAHMAARCAHDQGRFWAMHDLLFANQRALSADELPHYARQLDLDVASFESCLRQERHAVEIDRDIAAAKAAGVTGTPATFVNGTLLSGARPVDSFVEAIEAEL